MATTLDRVIDEIRAIQQTRARQRRRASAAWPMIVLATPKGWTGPKVVDGKRVEGYLSRAPGAADRSANEPRTSEQLEAWMRSYRPDELFDANGRLRPSSRRSRRAATGGWARILTPTAGCCCAICSCRTSATMPSTCQAPGARRRRHAGARPFLRDVIVLNEEARNFRLFGPDETVSNRLDAVFEATNRQWDADTHADDHGSRRTGA